MSDDKAERAAVGVSFLFSTGERPDIARWRAAVNAGPARAQVVHEEPAAGRAELVLDGLTFDVEGLSSAKAASMPALPQGVGLSHDAGTSGLEAVHLYPGHHLSGGLRLMPVIRALVAVTADIAIRVPARGVVWRPAGTLVAPQTFAHSALAWLAGGAFPASTLTSLALQPDGGVVSRGLAHFIGRELTLRGRPGESADEAMALTARIVDHLVLHGPVTTITELAVAGEALCFEPAHGGDHLWVWRKAA
jgi:hypothetical protein